MKQTEMYGQKVRSQGELTFIKWILQARRTIVIYRSCPYNLLLHILCADPLASILAPVRCYSVPSPIPETSVCLPQCHPANSSGTWRFWYKGCCEDEFVYICQEL